MARLRVQRPRCEHLADPLGIDTAVPRLSWDLRSPRRGARQEGYRLRAASSPGRLAQPDLWDSAWVASADRVLVPWGGPALASRQQVWWSVEVEDERGARSALPQPARFETGLLSPSDWSADWIAAPEPGPQGSVAYLRAAFRLDNAPAGARAYVTALGLYELHCNGRRVGDARLTPGWTDYARRLQYQVLDLDGLVQPGENVVGAVLAEGWYAGNVGFLGQRGHYGDTPQLLVQVEVGGRAAAASGAGWEAGSGPLRSSDLLDGETWDLRAADPGWCRSVGGWAPARLTAGSPAPRVCSPAPPVRVLRELPAISVERTGAQTHRVDLGQNLVGWLRLRLDGPAGTAVTVRHAEVLDADGALYTANLRGADATDRYLLAGDGPAWCEPSLTFHGFRWAEVDGHAGDLAAADVVGVVCGSDVEETGAFACSDERVNRLHANIVWGARGNLLEIPTDCPQRDERLGWMGDAQVFAATACHLFDLAGFWAKWLRDVGDAQSQQGGFPDVAPRVVDVSDGAPGWGDAGVIVPWVVSRWYADDRLLSELYPAMRRWVDLLHAENPSLLWLAHRGHDMGDWLAVEAETDKDLIATAFFARSARLTACAAAALLRGDEAAELHRLADGIEAAFRDAFVLADGRLKDGTQTAYALALRFGLLADEQRAAAVDHLVADVEERGGHLSTGFLGVAHLLPALTDGGRVDVAYRLLLTEDWPGWLYAVAAGATTIWERWDGWTAERGFADPEMNSFNHYAFGAVGEWLYRVVGGVAPAEPGAEADVVIAPRPGAGIDWAQAAHRSPLGRVACRWERGGNGGLTLQAEVPVGATARIEIPAAPGADVREGGLPLAQAPLVELLGAAGDGTVAVAVPAGSYRFTVEPRSSGK